jgi:hypothetical protein
LPRAQCFRLLRVAVEATAKVCKHAQHGVGHGST